MEESGEDLWEIGRAANYLATTVSTLRMRCSRREIPFLKFGRSVRFRRCDLDAYVQRHLVEPMQSSDVSEQEDANKGIK